MCMCIAFLLVSCEQCFSFQFIDCVFCLSLQSVEHLSWLGLFKEMSRYENTNVV